MSSILGHSHPEIVKVVSEQVGKLDHLLSSFISEPVADLADLLTSLMPAPLDKTFFLNTGSETTEAAIKIAKCATGKFEIIAFAASYRKPPLSRLICVMKLMCTDHRRSHRRGWRSYLLSWQKGRWPCHARPTCLPYSSCP
jgi:4-aminobutyrate aminotransferase-like enzyme